AFPPVPQPARSSAAPIRTTERRNELRRRVAARRSQLRDRFVARRIDREDPIETRDLEDLRDVPVAADERELAVVRAEPLDAAHEDAERRRIDEGRVAEVDDDLLAALADHLEQLLLELRRRVQIDLTRERDDVGGSAELLGLDVEVHARSLPGSCSPAQPGRSGESLSTRPTPQSRYFFGF